MDCILFILQDADKVLGLPFKLFGRLGQQIKFIDGLLELPAARLDLGRNSLNARRDGFDSFDDAFNVLSNALPDEKVFKVRHPSYGGQNEFLQTMRDLYADILIETEPDLFSTSIFNDQLERGGSELA